MPLRRYALRRSFAGIAVAALTLTLASGPAAGASPDPRLATVSSVAERAVTWAGAGAPGRRVGPGSDRLRGRLAGLVRSAAAGRVGPDAYRGFELAALPGRLEVAVALRFTENGGEAALAALTAVGARVVNRNGSAVDAYLPVGALSLLATLDGVEEAQPIIRPVPLGTIGIGNVGEGVALHHAADWQAAGVVGSGVKVGIIDGGFVGLGSRLGRELPSSVHARCYREVGLYASTVRSCEDFTDHGTAVAETIADMAPGASLYVANPVSLQDLQSTVAWMTSNGVRIINVSLGFSYEGPGDGSSPSDSIYSVLDQAVKGGALWVNAAGNAGEDGWAGTWKDANHNDVLEFSGGDESNSIRLVADDAIVVSMRWDETWGASRTDYDLYVYGSSPSEPVAASEDEQDGGGDPVESLSFTPETTGTYRIVVTHAGGPIASHLQLLVLSSASSALQYRTAANTLPSPADSANPGMISVGAVSFDTPDVIESYSSRGPTTDDRIKPDLVAADCTTTSLINPFCGTSESTPYTTGAAALVLSAKPELTPAQLADWLRSHAIPLGSPSPNPTFGWGRLDLGPPPAPPAATTLAFTASPAVAIVGVKLWPEPALRILDQGGQTLTSGPASTSTVTLALASGGAGATLTCDGGPTRAAVGGVATFSGCAITGATGRATLLATVGSLPPATSAAFDVVAADAAPSPSAAISASATAISWGGPATLRVTLAATSGSPVAAPLRGRSVTVERSTDRSTWTTVGTVVTDAGGTASLAYRPVTNLYYRATLAAAPDLGAATSGTTRVTVRQIALMRPSNGRRVAPIAPGRTITFTTLVRPARSDVVPGSVTFEVYRRNGSRWQRVLTRVVQPTAGGSASLAVTFDRAGSWYVRSMAMPTRVNANSVWTPAEQFLVR